ncbi:unnamed protein product [Adineta steineri]|uniref:UBC core domain-containing protein n=1 Tax=Adineta steineri TaxID=433720 RepID=A0A815RKP3_9BILA|nr:unnamed protein product [Adineta steineri]CAF4121068.1 unnamed protein product [Adineta steineri]
MTSIGRLLKEWKEFQRNAPGYIFAEPMNDDMFNWRAKNIGPPDTPFAGGIFIVDISFSQKHPIEPPQCVMKTKMFHRNISSTGKISISIFEKDWIPVLTIRSILLSIYSILDDPLMDNPINHEAARCFSENPTKYDSSVRECTLNHANESSIPDENE